jgi:hypothetical protein
MKVSAIITATIKVYVDGNWQDECAISQVHKQAKEAALKKLAAISSIKGLIITKPTVESITLEEFK